MSQFSLKYILSGKEVAEAARPTLVIETGKETSLDVLPCGNRVDRLIKRSVDVIAAFFGLLMLSPVLVAIGIIIRIDSPGPIFFFQQRLGRGGQPR